MQISRITEQLQASELQIIGSRHISTNIGAALQAERSSIPFQEATKIPAVPERSLSPQELPKDANNGPKAAEAQKNTQQSNGRDLSIDLQEDAASFIDDVGVESHPLSAAKSQVAP